MPSIGLGIGKKKEDKPEITNQKSEIINTPQEESNRPFTADQLRDAWVGLAAVHSNEPRLKELIETYIPRLLDEQTAEIQMPNPWQMDQMRKAMPELARQLRAVLHNNLLHIQLTQAEYTREQMAFTSEEKYKVMLEQNPALSQLKDRLNLVID